MCKFNEIFLGYQKSINEYDRIKNISYKISLDNIGKK
jgi:hypothetical protein